MKHISVKITRSFFPLSGINVKVNNEKFKIQSGEKVRVPLNKSDNYKFIIKLLWIEKEIDLKLNDDSTVKIKHVIPDFYYITSFVLLLGLIILSFIGLINVLILSTVLLVYVSPLIYFTFFNQKNYFDLEVN